MFKISIISLLLFAGIASAESKLFSEPLKPLNVTLKANFKLVNTPGQTGAEIGRNDLGRGMIDAEYFESAGTMEYVDASGKNVIIDVDVQPRGMRRRRSCEYKPLDVKPKHDPKDEVFAGTTAALEIVTHCQGTNYFRDLYNEYFNYRIKGAFGVPVFHVRLAQITYVDTENKFSTITMPAVFLEAKKDLGPRIGGKVMKLSKEEEKVPPTASERAEAGWSSSYGDSFVPRIVNRIRVYKKYQALLDKTPMTMRQTFLDIFSDNLVSNGDVAQQYLLNTFAVQYASGAVTLVEYDFDAASPGSGFDSYILQTVYTRYAKTLGLGTLNDYKTKRSETDKLADRAELLAAIQESLQTYEASGLEQEVNTHKDPSFSTSSVKSVSLKSATEMKNVLANPDQALAFLK